MILAGLTLEEFREKYLNKRIRITTDIGDHWGNLTFVGPNLALGWPLQLTLDRAICTPKEVYTVEEIINKSIFD